MEYATVFLPLIGAIVSYFGKSLGNLFSQIISCFFIFISAILSILIFYEGIANDNYGNYLIFQWINSGNFVADWSIKIDPVSSVMFDDIAKNLVPAKNVGFSSVWIDHGYENLTDDIKNSEKYLDYKTKDLSLFLDKVNRGEI